MPSWATPLPTPLFPTPCLPPPLAACLLFISKTFTSYKICWGWAPKDKQMLREGGSKKWGLPKFVYPVVSTDSCYLFYELQTAGFGGYIPWKGIGNKYRAQKLIPYCDSGLGSPSSMPWVPLAHRLGRVPSPEPIALAYSSSPAATHPHPLGKCCHRNGYCNDNYRPRNYRIRAMITLANRVQGAGRGRCGVTFA